MMAFSGTSLRLGADGLFVLDQTRLPHVEIWLPARTAEEMTAHIRALRVRGAPLIGVAAALQAGWLAAQGASPVALEADLALLRAARPTAVNLMNAIDRCLAALHREGPPGVTAEAQTICREDVELCDRLAAHGASCIEDGDQILTHCNTGGLATAGAGTALAAILKAAQTGKRVHVYVDETRPLLQGARLTTWELARARVPHTLICDNMAGALMAQGRVSRVFVGADRIAANGDFANKIGTYALAVLAKFHGIPFFVVAPRTTLDPACPHGAAIPVEERAPSEVRGSASPAETAVWNPAFDVTPACLVSGWIFEDGLKVGANISGNIKELR